MGKFTNCNLPGFVGGECHTVFYEGCVDEYLLRVDGTVAPVVEWDLRTDIPMYTDENELRVVRVTRIPDTSDEIKRLHLATLNARHYNIRLIVPRYDHYPLLISVNIED